MQKNEQSSRQIVMCHLMAIMGFDIEKAKNIVSEMEEKGLIQFDELGNDVEWQVLNSKDFQAPQNRERIFIIGHSRRYRPRFLFPLRGENSSAGLERLGNVNPSGKGMNREVYLSRGLAPTLTRGKGEGTKIAIPVLTPDRLEKRQHGRRYNGNDDTMFTLTSRDRHGVVVAGTLPTSFIQTGRVYDLSGLSPTLTTMQGGDKVPKILYREEAPHLKIILNLTIKKYKLIYFRCLINKWRCLVSFIITIHEKRNYSFPLWKVMGMIHLQK